MVSGSRVVDFAGNLRDSESSSADQPTMNSCLIVSGHTIRGLPASGIMSNSSKDIDTPNSVVHISRVSSPGKAP